MPRPAAGTGGRQQDHLIGVGQALVALGQGQRAGEALFVEQFRPRRGRDERVVGADVGVAEAPPALGEAEDQVEQPPRAGPLEQHQHAARRRAAGGRRGRSGAGRPWRAGRWPR